MRIVVKQSFYKALKPPKSVVVLKFELDREGETKWRFAEATVSPVKF